MSDFTRAMGWDSPDILPTQVALDPNTKKLMDEQAQRAMRPSSAFRDELNQGIDRASNVGQFGGGGGMAQTGMSPGQFEAMRNVYAGQTGDALNRIRANHDIMAEQRKMQELKQTSQYALQQQGLKNNAFANLTAAYNQMDAQRAQFISALTGLANYGIGTYAGAQHNKISPDQTIAQAKRIDSNPNFFNAQQNPYGPQSSSYLDAMNNYGMGGA